MEPNSPDSALVQKAIDLISEHYDTVQVFVTRHEQGSKAGTFHIERGSGNLYARMGHVREWLVSNEEVLKQEIRREE